MTYLAHHGILGMKWGIRRYQNPDGTLTEAGKKRYAKDISEGAFSRDKKKRQRYIKAKQAFVDSVDLESYEPTVYKLRELGLKKTAAEFRTPYEESLEANRLSDEAVAIVNDIGKKIVGDAGNSFVQNHVGEAILAQAKNRVLMKESAEKITNPGKYWKEVKAEVHTENIADKAEKAAKEHQILLFGNNPEASARQMDVSAELFNRIINESGDWYNGTAVTKNFADAMQKYNKANDNYKNSVIKNFKNSHRNGNSEEALEEVRKAMQNVAGVVLNDIGYENNLYARNLIMDYIFWD